ncbi:rhodanese-like domain-containing protein [bacterium]|nr:rhodanese-like domain-containing protein [bacterium]
MAIEQIVPKEAAARMKDAKNPATYLDVRTVEEYEAGHPDGAYNVPVLTRESGQMMPNANFLADTQKLFPPDKRLVVGCMAGGRSQRACEILESAQFSSLANVRGGFGGARDPSGQVVTPGWSQEGLPVETGNPEGRAYRR